MSGKHASITRVATIMFLYGVLLLSGGITAYLMAPPGANAKTAIIITGICAVLMFAMGFMSLLLKTKRGVGMIGIHVGLILPLIFAFAFLMRAGSNYEKAGIYNYFQKAYIADIENRNVADNPSVRETYLSGAKPDGGGEIPAHDTSYLGLILTLLFGISAAAFMFLLLSRPKIPPKPAIQATDPAPGEKRTPKPDFAPPAEAKAESKPDFE